eukprot:CAMPEP_0178461348 /NCGR_PEP_ID=MMETSP0689_2-20121128/49260_1 /TAXON_ID=160604 /ORGANISM="Amphidinium massartii, Strain CS-259" /LENGTH=109 /DNA_ID=CAMNT_0020088175 /DNA_START=31 /DNA_END=363 /DNA_ORIENTATION=+
MSFVKSSSFTPSACPWFPVRSAMASIKKDPIYSLATTAKLCQSMHNIRELVDFVAREIALLLFTPCCTDPRLQHVKKLVVVALQLRKSMHRVCDVYWVELADPLGCVAG